MARSITITLSCTCDEEEHEIDLERDGSGGVGEGDVLPCGRVIDREAVDEIQRAFYERGLE